MDNRPKVIPMRRNNLVEMIETLLEMAKSGQITNIVAAGFTKDGNVFSAIVNTTVVEQYTLISYMNTDAVIRTVENYHDRNNS